MVTVNSTLLAFVVALIVSAIIIYVVTKLFGETEDLKTAIVTALAGTIVYAIIYFLLGNGMIAGFIAGIAWLLVIQHFYSVGWIKSMIIAVVVWIVTSVVGMFLPVL
jgi:hypothetical protein